MEAGGGSKKESAAESERSTAREGGGVVGGGGVAGGGGGVGGDMYQMGRAQHWLQQGRGRGWQGVGINSNIIKHNTARRTRHEKPRLGKHSDHK